MRLDDESLCCCEYIDEDGKRSHLLAALCNCEAFDEIFDRFITRRGINAELSNKVMSDIEDRLRLPWRGGAKKISLPIVLPLILNVCILLLGSLNYYLTSLTYLVFLPTMFYLCHKLFKKRRKNLYLYPNTKTSLGKLKGYYEFYTTWLVSCIAYLFIIYYVFVIGALKISSIENLIFIILFVSMGTCFYIVIKKGQMHVASSKVEKSESLQSLLTCLECSFEEAKNHNHCKICGVCYICRDHHCLWLNICIGHINDRWFFAALVLALNCLLYGCQLSFTTVCHPRVIAVGQFEILYPYQCPNAYFDFSSAITFSGGWYAIILVACVTVLLIQQIISISRGGRRPSLKHKSRRSRNLVLKVLVNWYHFWKH